MTIDWSGAAWRKSTRSGQDDSCVELARVGDVIGVRHSKRPGDGVIEYTLPELAAFLAGAKDGEFDDLIA